MRLHYIFDWSIYKNILFLIIIIIEIVQKYLIYGTYWEIYKKTPQSHGASFYSNGKIIKDRSHKGI